MNKDPYKELEKIRNRLKEIEKDAEEAFNQLEADSQIDRTKLDPVSRDILDTLNDIFRIARGEA